MFTATCTLILHGKSNQHAAAEVTRALLDRLRETLSASCGTIVLTPARIEAGEGPSPITTMDAIRAPLEGAGVEYIEQDGGEPGVLLRKLWVG